MKLVLTWIWILELVLDVKDHLGYLWNCDRFEPYVWSI